MTQPEPERVTQPATPPMDPVETPRARARARAGAVVLLLALPLALLRPSLLGDEVFLPFSPAAFPPFAAELPPQLLVELQEDANFDVTEVPLTFVPELQHVRAELAEGRLPHWNPWARFGASLLATSVVGLMYPPNWLTFLLLEPAGGLALNAWLALAIAGLLMLGFLRALGLGWLPAVLGAVAFAWSGTLSANLHFYQRAHALVWLPGMLWALTRMAPEPGRTRWRAGAGLAVCLAMSWLAGFPAYAAGATLVAAAYGFSLVVRHGRLEGPRSAARLALHQAVCAGLGMALAAVQLLPMFAFFPESNRDPDPTPDSIASQAFDPMGFAGYVLPHPFGTPAFQQLPYDHSLLSWVAFSRAGWDSGIVFRPNYNFVEYAVYPGALVLALALVGALGARVRGRPFALLVLASLWLLATAGPTTAFLNDLPFVRSVPPLRFVGPACALIALLAAGGLARLGTDRSRVRAIAVVALCIAAASALARVALGGRSPQEWLAALTPELLERYRPRFPNVTPEMVAALFGDHPTGNFTRSAIELLGRDLAYAAVAFALVGAFLLAASWLARTARATRALQAVALAGVGLELVAFSWPVNQGRPEVPLAAPALDLLRAARVEHASRGGFAVVRGAQQAQLPTALPPSLLVPDRIRDLHAYTFVDARSHRLFEALYGKDHMLRVFWPKAFPDDARLARPLFDLLGVRYVLANEPLQHAGEPRGGGGRGSFHVYERPGALPRAFVVPELRELPDESAIVQALVAEDLEPARTVLVTPAQAAELAGHAGASGAHARAVRFVQDTPTGVRLEVEPGPPGFLVLSDALMGGWRATRAEGGAEAEAVPITRGNLFMRVVPVGSAATVVHFTFATPRLLGGALITGVAAFALLWLACRRRPSDLRTAPPLTVELTVRPSS